MSQFLQAHILTFYPPSNLNRDDSGRPKTATVGGSTRIRISSQCLKRAWRESPFFQESLNGHLAKRTKQIGCFIKDAFQDAGIEAEKAEKWAAIAAGAYGKVEATKKGASNLLTQELVFFSEREMGKIRQTAQQLAAAGREPKLEDFELLESNHGAVDIALFGRMLASHTEHNVEASAQVAHAFTVNRASVEDDFFSAVDDLKNRENREDAGAGHIDEAWFGSGVYYLYINVNIDQLVRNLGGSQDLAQRGLRALFESALQISPSGKQNSYAARSLAGYALFERGTSQPRSLAYAFLKPVTGKTNDLLQDAIEALEKTRDKLDNAYQISNESFKFDPFGKKTEPLDEILTKALAFQRSPA